MDFIHPMSLIGCFKCGTVVSLDNEFEDFRHPDRYFKELKTETESLRAFNRDIVEKLERNKHFLQLSNEVEQWRADVESLDQEVRDLEKGKRSRSAQGHETKKTLDKAKALIEQRKRWDDGKILIPITEKQVVEEIRHDSRRMVGVDFRRNLESVLKYLTQEQIFAVEIFGAAGIGKTTMLKEINNTYLREDNGGFTTIIYVDMNKTHTVGEIQKRIASRLGLNMDEFRDLDEDRRSEILLIILSHERFLVLLDEVRENVEFRKIGIPSTNGKSKLVYTTRIRKILWGSLDNRTVCTVKMGYLSEDDSKELFSQACGDKGKKALEQNETKKVVEEIINKCHGLPLALVVLGKATAQLESSNSLALENILASLNRARGEYFGEMLKSLKSSYDMLDDSDMKSCFLFCVLFGGYNDISTQRLVDCWIGEGLVSDKHIQTLHDLRCSAQNKIQRLIASSLLDQGSMDKFIRIHEIVRGMAGWLATNNEQGTENNIEFLVAEKKVKPAILVQMLERGDVKRVSLEDFDMEEVLQLAPNCPRLFTLLMGFYLENELQIKLKHRNLNYIKNRGSNSSIRSLMGLRWSKGAMMTGEYGISDNFFKKTPSMHVLDMTGQPLLRLPTSIYGLESLRYLNLSYTLIEEIPKAFSKLRQLVQLDLTGTMRLSFIPPTAILPGSQLRSFKLYGSRYKKIGEAGQISLEPFEASNLEEFEIPLENFMTVQRLSNSRQLSKWTTCLELYDIRDLNADSLFNDVLPNLCELKTLSIKFCIFSNNVLTLKSQPRLASLMLEGTNMSTIDLYLSENEGMDLRELHIFRCAQLRDLMCLTQLNSLQILEIRYCEALKQLLPRINKMPRLDMLKSLTLDTLPELKRFGGGTSPFRSKNILDGLPSMEQLHILGCPKLKGFPAKKLEKIIKDKNQGMMQ